MKLKHLLCALAAILVCSLSACTSSEDEPTSITVPDEQTSITVPANQYSAEVKFTAAAPWSAYTSTEAREANDVEWIHLNDTHGSAGAVNLSFTLDYNNTGASRTAYIVILCEDTKVVITITQTSEDNPDVQNPIDHGTVEIEVNEYIDSGGIEFDGTTTYMLEYGNGLPLRMECKWRDDIEGYDSYCLNVETYNFTWDGNNRADAQNVKVDVQTEATYYPSERKEIEDPSEHYAEVRNGMVVSGWYWWPQEDRYKTDWDASYDTNGYLVSSKNNDGADMWGTCTMTWTDGNLTKITSDDDSYVTITYADPSLVNRHHEFDINWVLPAELECYDFAAGDISKIFPSIGLMGKASKSLITSITEYNDSGAEVYSYRMSYSENTKDKTVVKVMRFANGIQTSYSEWTIKYFNIK